MPRYLVRNADEAKCKSCGGIHSFLTQGCVPMLLAGAEWVWDERDVVYVAQDRHADSRYGVRTRLNSGEDGGLPIYIYDCSSDPTVLGEQ